MIKKKIKKTIIRTDEFAKLAGVSKMAISKAVKSGHIIKNKRGSIDFKNQINVDYIKSNKSKRKSHKIAAKISKLTGNKTNKKKLNNKKHQKKKNINNEISHDDEDSSEEEKQYLSKLDIEKAKLAVETKLKQIQLAEAMREVIPLKLVKARLGGFATVLQNTILILPEKLADEIINIVLKKGIDSRADIVDLFSKALAFGIKESKKAIDDVTDYELRQE